MFLVQELDDINQKITKEGSILNLIGKMYHNLGQYQKALEIYNQAQIIYEKVLKNKSLVGETLIKIGAVYNHLYQHEKALAYYQHSVTLYQEAKDQNGEGIALANMGNAFYNMGKYQQALIQYQQALKIFQKTSRHNEGSVFLRLGDTYLVLDQPQKALQSYQQAQTIYEAMGAGYGDGLAFCGRGNVYRILGQYKKALPLFQYCLDILEGFDALNNLWLAQAQLGFVEAQLKKHQKAVRHYRQALNSIESLRTTLTSAMSRLLFIQDKYYVYDEFIQLLQSLHKMYPTQGYNYESLKIFEKKQGRMFVEKIAKSGARRFTNLPFNKADEERKLEDQLAKIRANLIKKSPELTNEQLIKRFDKLKKEQQIFLKKLETDFFDYYTFKYSQPATLEALQNRVLKEGEMLLIYGVMETNTVLWVVGKGYFEMFALPGETALQKQVDAFFNVIKTMQKAVTKTSDIPFDNQQLQDWLKQKSGDTLPKLVKTSHSLYKKLLPVKIRKRLEQAELVYIVPTGSLYSLPFEALVTTAVKKNETPHYLIQDFTIAYLSSASLLKTLRNVPERRKNKASQPLLAFANPDFPSCAEQNSHQKRGADTNNFIGLRTIAYRKLVDDCFRRLPETEQEVREIADFLNAPHDKALKLGKVATRETVLNSKLDDYRHLVFATHAILPHEINGIVQPAIVLSYEYPNDEDAYLTMADVLQLQLNADSVTLSACNTGHGKQIKGEGIMGLTRAFMYAGTPTVSVTLWEVESQSAKSLSTGTFKYFVETPPSSSQQKGKTQTKKMNLAKALQKIKLEMLSGKGKPYEYHPYFWAPFVIWGDGTVMQTPHT